MKKVYPRKCLNCKEKFIPVNQNNTVCSTKCAIEYSKAAQKKKKEKEWKKEKAVLKDKTTNWKKELQKSINKIVRLIDKDLPCLARNINGQIHAGHIYSVGSNQTIRFNLHNIHRQCAQSNHFQNDDGLLREGLVNEYGAEYMDFISCLRRTPKIEHNTLELKDIVLKARKIALSLSKSDLNYSLKNRILMRNKINQELGIYPIEFCIFEL